MTNNGNDPHKEGRPEQTQIEESLADSRGNRTAERFAAIPQRVVDAFAFRELDKDDLVILVWIVAHTPPPRRAHATTLAELKQNIHWDRTTQALSDRLVNLRERGWIDFKKPKPGQTGVRATWLIRLTGADLEHVEASSKSAPSQLQVTSKSEVKQTRTVEPKTDLQDTDADADADESLKNLRSYVGEVNNRSPQPIPGEESDGDEGRTAPSTPHDALAELTRRTRDSLPPL
jgi:hypothetical protein